MENPRGETLLVDRRKRGLSLAMLLSETMNMSVQETHSTKDKITGQ